MACKVIGGQVTRQLFKFDWDAEPQSRWKLLSVGDSFKTSYWSAWRRRCILGILSFYVEFSVVNIRINEENREDINGILQITSLKIAKIWVKICQNSKRKYGLPSVRRTNRRRTRVKYLWFSQWTQSRLLVNTEAGCGRKQAGYQCE